MLRVATYNIQKSVGLDTRRDPRRILDVISALDPDVLALQEVDQRFGERRSTLPLGLIEAKTNLKVVEFGSYPHGLGWHGNTILVRDSIEVLEKREIHLPQLEPRGAAMVTVRANGLPIRVVGAHLSLVAAFRRRQVSHIVEDLVSARDRPPTVVMGDLNEWYEASASMRAFMPAFQPVQTGRSFPAAFPVARLDRIFISPDLAARDFGVHHARPARIASDHLPVWAEISPASEETGR